MGTENCSSLASWMAQPILIQGRHKPTFRHALFAYYPNAEEYPVELPSNKLSVPFSASGRPEKAYFVPNLRHKNLHGLV